jgi:hypothetical protein
MNEAEYPDFSRSGARRNRRSVSGCTGSVGIALLLLALCGMTAWAQDVPNTLRASNFSGSDSLRIDLFASTSPGQGEKLLWLAGATFSYAMFDYIGYNLVRDNTSTLPIYRVMQALVQAGITWILYEKLGLPTAAAFNLVWWTWGTDALFYGYTELFNVGGNWKGRGVFQSDIMDNNCTWASWTPVGMLRGMDSSRPISGDTLLAQFLVGAVAAVTITVTF